MPTKQWFDTVPSPRGALVELASQTKLQVPPNRNMKHYKLVEFLSNLNVKPPPHERKAPPRTRKTPLIDDFLATVLV